MSGFSSDWLKLRESADHRARNRQLLAKLAAHFTDRETVLVVDLGTGTGSNLRAIAPQLPALQQWILVDHDPALLTAACDCIAAWADSSRPTATGIEASKGGRSILVELKRADLSAEPAAWGGAAPDLVTAAALFDLVSATWIDRFVTALARSRLAFYTALTHSHTAEWNPPHPADAAMTKAFESHFGSDKGFGPSAGSRATDLLANKLSAAGYQVESAPSPWQLGRADAALIATLADGWAAAVRETKRVTPTTISDWLAARKAEGVSCVVGHKDLLALPR